MVYPLRPGTANTGPSAKNWMMKEAASRKEAASFYISTNFDRFCYLQQSLWQPYIAKYP